MSKNLHYRRELHFLIYSCIALSNTLCKSHSLGFHHLVFSCSHVWVIHLSVGKQRRTSSSTSLFSLGGICMENAHCKSLRTQSLFREQRRLLRAGPGALLLPSSLPARSPCSPQLREKTETFAISVKIMEAFKIFNLKAVLPCSHLCSSYQ